jgi:hypothetical protein
MIKKIFTLVVTSSLISAGFLYLGITMMGQYSPALASSLNALVAENNVQKLPSAIPSVNSDPLTADLSTVEEDLGSTLTPNYNSISPVGSDQPLQSSVKQNTTEETPAGVTIAELLNDPDRLINQVITITGIASSLGNEKFLLNDGTGQILVEADDVLVSLATLDGLSITVLGKLDDSSSQTGYELDAITLTYPDGSVVGSDDCIGDNCPDDCIGDNCPDDCIGDNCPDDCIGDNCPDDCIGDNCPDDCIGDNCPDDCIGDDCPDDDLEDGSDDDIDDVSDDDIDDDSSDDDIDDSSEDDSADSSDDDSSDDDSSDDDSDEDEDED